MNDARRTAQGVDQSLKPWSWFDVLLILIGIVLIFLLGMSLYTLWARLSGADIDRAFQPSITLSLALAGLETVALVGSVYILGMRRLGLQWEDVGFKPVSVAWLILVLTLSIIVIPLSGLISTLILIVMGKPLENPQLPFLVPEGFSWFGAIGMVLLGGIAVPFGEELFFRGVLYPWMKSRWGMWMAVLLSSLIFGVVHVDIAVGGAAFILGIVLAFVYEYSRSLWAAFLIHALNNSIKIVLLYALVAFGFDMAI